MPYTKEQVVMIIRYIERECEAAKTLEDCRKVIAVVREGIEEQAINYIISYILKE